jgi:hypothetical protein
MLYWTHKRQRFILWPDNRICLGAEWALHIHFDFILLTNRVIRLAQYLEILRTAHICIEFSHGAFKIGR